MNTDCFVDVGTGEVIDDVDSEGVDLIGIDEWGAWWGTPRAAWVISQQPFTVEVWGYAGADPYFGHFVGTPEEARDYVERRRIRVDWVVPGLPTYGAMRIYYTAQSG